MNERVTTRDIAGFCPEEAVWKMLVDISGFLLREKVNCVLTPDSIVIDGNTFMIEAGHEIIDEFLSPEQTDMSKTDLPQMVWALGALAFYLATGHVLFGGHGGHYQKEHPSVALPVLPKGFQAMTPMVQRCLCFVPEERITMKELNSLSQKGLTECGQLQRRRTMQLTKTPFKGVQHSSEKWPEQMIEL